MIYGQHNHKATWIVSKCLRGGVVLTATSHNATETPPQTSHNRVHAAIKCRMRACGSLIPSLSLFCSPSLPPLYSLFYSLLPSRSHGTPPPPSVSMRRPNWVDVHPGPLDNRCPVENFGTEISCTFLHTNRWVSDILKDFVIFWRPHVSTLVM